MNILPLFFRKLGVLISKRLRIYAKLKDLQLKVGKYRAYKKTQKKKLDALEIKHFDGLQPEKRSETLCLFSSYDIESIVDDYVVYYLKALREQLKADIVFISTSAEMPESELEKLRPLCRKIIHRENIGHDFGSWKIGMAKTKDWETYSLLVLANDSVYGPFTDLSEIFAPLQSREPTLVSVTENFEIERHLQSYFLSLNQAAARSRFFKRFWKKFKFFKNREMTIERYEIGFSRAASRAKCRLIPLRPYMPIQDRAASESPQSYSVARAIAEKGVNPTHYFWKELITKWNAPFLKVDLVRDNPLIIPFEEHPVSVVSKNTTYPPSLITKHQQRLTRRK